MRRIFLNLDQITLDELGSKTLPQLRDIAKEIGIKSTSKYKKNEFIVLISENIKEDIKEQEHMETKVH
ncbi:MAG: Rho termination factor N-terminal domain-containing protein, partial [Romboutsia sp.]|nr:Rho termination factor N-terminal domain-containing protein [Romboutsia sp.]